MNFSDHIDHAATHLHDKLDEINSELKTLRDKGMYDDMYYFLLETKERILEELDDAFVGNLW